MLVWALQFPALVLTQRCGHSLESDGLNIRTKLKPKLLFYLQTQMPPKKVVMPAKSNANKSKTKDSDEAYTTTAGKQKKEKDPDAPKRPQSSYFLFMNDRRKTLKVEQPSLGMGESTKLMTDEWKALTEKQKKKWDDLAAKDKERYNNEMEEKGMGKAKKQESDVKKPLSGYMHFGKEMREKLAKQNLSATEMMKKIGGDWKELTDKQKEKYEKMAKDDKVRYEKELTKSEAPAATSSAKAKGKPAQTKTTPAAQSNKKVAKKKESEKEDEEEQDEEAEAEEEEEEE